MDNAKSFAKRDSLLELQRAAQAKWDAAKSFEVDAPAPDAPDAQQPKYFANFPYPYMNGMLHMGHTFTLGKAEFSIGYERLKGKKTLWPFGFHVTGMPIRACADKLKREVETYGNPPVFPVEEEDAPAAPVAKAEASATPGEFHAKKSKAVAKKGVGMSQWQIMKQSGIPDEEIAKFTDPNHWLQFFPPLAMRDLKDLGCKVDWRRSFITTDVNPYYDAFIRWQFETLKKLNKVQFGKRYSIYSELDGQPCADHDRQTGEGVLPQEYTLVKLKAVSNLPEALAALGRDVFLAAATLRPETMYGQTNCWVLPDGDYGAYETSEGVLVMGTHAARNLKHQEKGSVELLAMVKGSDLLGVGLKAPYTSYDIVYTLPMLTISMTKGTGVVTSVPSDAPDDYAALMDLKNKAPLREKFGLKEEWVMPFEAIPIIEIPDIGADHEPSTLSAVKLCQEMKIVSQNDKDRLATAKERVYLKGFYEGVMLVGDFKGSKVCDAKQKCKEALLATKEALVYSEPEKQVMSRSGDECVVALCNQWYLTYGEEEWKAKTEQALANMNTFSPELNKAFEATLAWLNQWACSRSYGLGSRMPWDPQYLIESLSDSTIYMAYYTFCHFLHGNLDGSVPGLATIRPEQLTNEVLDHILLGAAPPPATDIPADVLARMRREFDYWYPFDLRVSGKDLINNHLTFCLYNHTAIFPPEKWPAGMRCNGHLCMNSMKMSKSTGNFLTLTEAIGKYSSDALRLGLGDAGDSLDDANFVETTANMAILRLCNLVDWVKEVLGSVDQLRVDDGSLFVDKAFANDINIAITGSDDAFAKMIFRDGLRLGFFDLQNARDSYRDRCAQLKVPMHKALVLRYIEVQAILLSVYCPHTCEHLWELLGKDGLVVDARFPVADPIDPILTRQNAYLDALVHSMRVKIASIAQPKGKKGAAADTIKKATHAKILVADAYPDWQIAALTFLSTNCWDEQNKKLSEDTLKRAKESPELKAMMKQVMPFIAFVKDEVNKVGKDALETSLPFDERQLIVENMLFLQGALELTAIDFLTEEEATAVIKKRSATPGKPQVVYYHDGTEVVGFS